MIVVNKEVEVKMGLEKVCENCEYFSRFLGVNECQCPENIEMNIGKSFFVDNDFGCNRFKEKKQRIKVCIK